METPYIVTSTRQLLALASPGREDIIDALAVLGPSSVPEIARFLGRSRQALYYHVRALHGCGLLLERQVRENGTKPTAIYDLPGRPVIVRYDLSTPRTQKAVLALGRARLRSGARGFTRACRPEVAVTEGPRRNLWVAHWKGWLTAEDLEEANGLLVRLVEVFRRGADAPGGPRQPHELTFALAPVIAAEPGAEADGSRGSEIPAASTLGESRTRAT